ncbi:oxidoreductase [Catellatospora coxensis]|nr:oxidoreductase [Catellatospora coxensis]
MTMDPLAPLLKLADVESAVNGARAAVDGAYKHRALRRQGGVVAAEISLRCAVASAALEGHRYELSDVRGGTVLDAVLQGALRVAEALPGLHQHWHTSPRQVLAKLHLLAGTGVLPDATLGRPAADSAARLDTLLEIVSAQAGNPLIRAAVVHGELLAIEAFPGVNGIVARAAARLTLVGSGFDPRGLVAVELAHLAREPEYIGAAGAFATGTPDGLRSWLRHYATAVEQGCAEIAVVGDAVLAAVG